MPPTSVNPNDSWASGNRSGTNLPRSTSVEYEKETQSTVNRRLAPPPNRLAQRNARPVSKTTSIRHVPGSDGEEEELQEDGRGKTPFEQIVEISKRFAPAQFLMRQRSQEPETPETGNGNANHDQSTSYEYSAEEREYQATVGQKATVRHRRNRMSTDNKAYRPTVSDLEETDEEISDGGRRTRRKKGRKSGAVGGPLTNLPVAGYDKRRRRRKGTKGNGAEGEEENEDEDDDESDEENQEIERVSEQVRNPQTLLFTPNIELCSELNVVIPLCIDPHPSHASRDHQIQEHLYLLENIRHHHSSSRVIWIPQWT